MSRSEAKCTGWDRSSTACRLSNDCALRSSTTLVMFTRMPTTFHWRRDRKLTVTIGVWDSGLTFPDWDRSGLITLFPFRTTPESAAAASFSSAWVFNANFNVNDYDHII